MRDDRYGHRRWNGIVKEWMMGPMAQEAKLLESPHRASAVLPVFVTYREVIT